MVISEMCRSVPDLRRRQHGLFKGPQANVRLMPVDSASHPASGSAGDLFVDRGGRLWFCKGGTTWKQLA